MTDTPSQDRLQSVERRFHHALRDGDHEALERLLDVDFTATDLRGDGRIFRREFLRQAIYTEITAPSSEPNWTVADAETPAGAIDYSWTDDDGVRNVRASFWHNTEEGLRLRQHIAVVGGLNGLKLRG